MNIQQFVGSVGGRPSLAYYFAGTLINTKPGSKLSKKVVYMDPHTIKNKQANIVEEYISTPANYHCSNARVIKMSQLDPSFSFGYLIRSYADLRHFQSQLDKINRETDSQYRVIMPQVSNKFLDTL